MTNHPNRSKQLDKMIADSRKGMDIDNAIAAYAGRDYTAPRQVVADSILFEDFPTFDGAEGISRLIDALIMFRSDNADAIFRALEHVTEYSECLLGFEALRQETPEEISARIDGYRKYVLQREAARRAEYERMKREFGDT